jgi:hypothetical protein
MPQVFIACHKLSKAKITSERSAILAAAFALETWCVRDAGQLFQKHNITGRMGAMLQLLSSTLKADSEECELYSS